MPTHTPSHGHTHTPNWYVLRVLGRLIRWWGHRSRACDLICYSTHSDDGKGSGEREICPLCPSPPPSPLWLQFEEGTSQAQTGAGRKTDGTTVAIAGPDRLKPRIAPRASVPCTFPFSRCVTAGSNRGWWAGSEAQIKWDHLYRRITQPHRLLCVLAMDAGELWALFNVH